MHPFNMDFSLILKKRFGEREDIARSEADRENG